MSSLDTAYAPPVIVEFTKGNIQNNHSTKSSDLSGKSNGSLFAFKFVFLVYNYEVFIGNTLHTELSVPINFDIVFYGSKKKRGLDQRGLNNASRELLLALKMGYAALVIDALLKVWSVGQRFTVRQAEAELQHLGIGRYSLRNALQCAPRRSEMFSTRLFALAGVERPKRGRPAQVYQLPSAASQRRWRCLTTPYPLRSNGPRSASHLV